MIKNRYSFIVALILFLSAPASVSSYQEKIILSVEAGKCALRVEADEKSRTLRLRVYPEHPDCDITRDDMKSALRAAFAKTDPPKPEGPYTSLYIGRLIDYPWLSAHLASVAYSDRRWDKKKGKPVSMNVNNYVAAVLSRKDVTAQIDDAFGEVSGYRIVSASVEKVLVGTFQDVPQYRGKMLPGRVPFDAQVWFLLEKH